MARELPPRGCARKTVTLLCLRLRHSLSLPERLRSWFKAEFGWRYPRLGMLFDREQETAPKSSPVPSSLPQEHEALPVHEPGGDRLERLPTGGLLRDDIDGRVEPAELRRV